MVVAAFAVTWLRVRGGATTMLYRFESERRHENTCHGFFASLRVSWCLVRLHTSRIHVFRKVLVCQSLALPHYTKKLDCIPSCNCKVHEDRALAHHHQFRIGSESCCTSAVRRYLAVIDGSEMNKTRNEVTYCNNCVRGLQKSTG